VGAAGVRPRGRGRGRAQPRAPQALRLGLALQRVRARARGGRSGRSRSGGAGASPGGADHAGDGGGAEEPGQAAVGRQPSREARAPLRAGGLRGRGGRAARAAAGQVPRADHLPLLQPQRRSQGRVPGARAQGRVFGPALRLQERLPRRDLRQRAARARPAGAGGHGAGQPAAPVLVLGGAGHGALPVEEPRRQGLSSTRGWPSGRRWRSSASGASGARGWRRARGCTSSRATTASTSCARCSEARAPIRNIRLLRATIRYCASFSSFGRRASSGCARPSLVIAGRPRPWWRRSRGLPRRRRRPSGCGRRRCATAALRP
jgi:hypothetical protein